MLSQINSFSKIIMIRIEEETVWLTQTQIADLFKTSINNITLDII
jgi:hypothetical protein